MKELNIFQAKGKLLTHSKEVAEMIGKDHKNLLADIRGYVEVLEMSSIFSPSDFFIETVYLDKLNRTKPCYHLTKKGCDMVANKMTGEKGVIFTATYATQFEKMEESLKRQPRVLSEREQLMASMKLSLETAEEISTVKQEVTQLKQVFDNELTLNHGQQQTLHHEIKKRVETIASDYEVPKQSLYSQIHKHLRKAFVTPRYMFVRRKDYSDAIKWVQAWRPLL